MLKKKFNKILFYYKKIFIFYKDILRMYNEEVGKELRSKYSEDVKKFSAEVEQKIDHIYLHIKEFTQLKNLNKFMVLK